MNENETLKDLRIEFLYVLAWIYSAKRGRETDWLDFEMAKIVELYGK